MIGRMRLSSNFFSILPRTTPSHKLLSQKYCCLLFFKFPGKRHGIDVQLKFQWRTEWMKKNPAGQTREFDIALTAGDKKQTALLGATICIKRKWPITEYTSKCSLNCIILIFMPYFQQRLNRFKSCFVEHKLIFCW